MRNNLLLLHFFSIFLNPQRVTLTYSAMTDGPIDVQLRWANLRAREHHVKGPKKLPRKMVLWRLILRKAEKAKRTTTWAPYRVQCPCLQCQNQPRWILLNFPSVDMGTLSKTVGFSLYPSHWVHVCVCDLRGNCLLESIHASVPLTLIENVGIRIRKLKPKKHISKAIGV